MTTQENPPEDEEGTKADGEENEEVTDAELDDVAGGVRAATSDITSGKPAVVINPGPVTATGALVNASDVEEDPAVINPGPVGTKITDLK